jgi:predicted nuclease of predicted toxin-antitoxin system
MKFLTDQDVYLKTSSFIRQLGHDVVTASGVGMHDALDIELLRLAGQHGRIMVTRDRDYGGLAMMHDDLTGVIYLRVEPTTLESIHLELERVLNKYSEVEMLSSFCVIEPGRHRMRRMK